MTGRSTWLFDSCEGQQENPADLSSSNPSSADKTHAGESAASMKRVRDLPLWPVWLNPDHRVETALVLMRGHKIPALGVVDGGTYVGVLFLEDLVGQPPEEGIQSSVRRDVPCVPSEAPLRRAAEMMVAADCLALPVVADGKFVGIVSARDLLQEMGRNYDPMTSLPWSDSLREWGAARLSEGREITVLFFDIDSFGNFNKRYGHLIGDQVLRLVADVFREAVDAERDHLCRYGGDEFAIGTLRPYEEALPFAARVARLASEVRLEGIPAPVTVSYGLSGGRRRGERTGTHGPATLDDLINMASKECMAAKGIEATLPLFDSKDEDEMDNGTTTAQPAQGPEVLAVTLKEEKEGYAAVVVIRSDSQVVTGVAVGASDRHQAGALAALDAVQRLRRGSALHIEKVMSTAGPDGAEILSIAGSKDGAPIIVTKVCTGDPARFSAEAVLEAFGENLS